MTRATTFRATAIVGGFLLAILMIMTVSRAAFSDPTSNDGNYVASGSVVLYNNAPGGGFNTSPGDETGDAMFGTWDGTWVVKADNLKPGDDVSHCIEIIYGGSLDATVKLDSITSDAPSVGGFRNQINVTVDRFTGACGSVGSATIASGTLATPVINESAWSAPAATSQFYLVTLELDIGADNTYQGASVDNINFEWLASQA